MIMKKSHIIVRNILEDASKNNLTQVAKTFIKHHPNPQDKIVHKFAMIKGYDIDKFEEAIYKIASKKVK